MKLYMLRNVGPEPMPHEHAVIWWMSGHCLGIVLLIMKLYMLRNVGRFYFSVVYDNIPFQDFGMFVLHIIVFNN